MQNPLQASAYTTPLVLTQTFIFLISFTLYFEDNYSKMILFVIWIHKTHYFNPTLAV